MNLRKSKKTTLLPSMWNLKKGEQQESRRETTYEIAILQREWENVKWAVEMANEQKKWSMHATCMHKYAHMKCLIFILLCISKSVEVKICRQ